ncbi:alpha/beta family hydrolase [Marinomonas flavescens]|uniref:alpha/beta family hydrolase n=1 Tax=Marinomonas flavescens TaxID=2529379 RepID=UPI0010542B9B|nr:alpha/beta family hydrolase [Marinomonas flavescens]
MSSSLVSKIPIYLAHGAGAGHQSSGFLKVFSEMTLDKHGRSVVPVTFKYMAEQESSGKKRPPPRFKTLVPEFIETIKLEESVIVAGKSMGGRVATQLSHQENVRAIICFGFPFYPSGKPEKHRLSFLEDVAAPCLIIQGTRDSLGKPDWVNNQTLNEHIEVHWIEGADHDFKTLKKQNLKTEDVIENISNVVEDWLQRHGLAS